MVNFERISKRQKILFVAEKVWYSYRNQERDVKNQYLKHIFTSNTLSDLPVSDMFKSTENNTCACSPVGAQY